MRGYELVYNEIVTKLKELKIKIEVKDNAEENNIQENDEQENNVHLKSQFLLVGQLRTLNAGTISIV